MNPSSSWLGNADPARNDLIKRALNVSGAGSVLLQVTINRVVQQLVLREFGMQAALSRKPGSGDAFYVNRRSAGTTGGAWVNDTDTATEETGSYAQVSFPFKTLLTKGQVTRKLQATGRSYGDVLATELASKASDFANLLESALIIGNNGSGGDSKSINGALTLIRATSSQVIAQTSASGGDAITLSKLDAAIDAVKGAGNRSDLVIVGSFLGCRKLNAALQAAQRFNDSVEISAGFRVRSYDGIPVIVSTGMPNALTWSGTDITAFSGGSTTALMVLNTRYLYIGELTPTTVMPLARTTSQNDNFEMFWDGSLVLENTLGAAILGGIIGS